MKLVALILILGLLTGCAETMTYTPPKPLDLPKIPEYKLPPDPFKDVPAPKAIFLARAKGINLPGNYWVEVEKPEAELICYTAKEHDKIVLRIEYANKMFPQLENLVNVNIQIANQTIQLVIDQALAKEVYKEMWIDTANARNKDKTMFGLEKFGMYGIIIGLIIEAAILAAH